jgi:uncharacterized protein (TIGR03663 family)
MERYSLGVQIRRISFAPASSLLFGVVFEGIILLLAGVLRLWMLDLKPAHFDEGINGWFIDQMRANGFYRYDPENYHGPLYFYILFVSLSLLGRNLWALRLPAVLASMASVWVALRFDRYFGALAARWGALALALSPAAVFYGRYAIHESWLVLSLMITLWGILGLWKEGTKQGLSAFLTGVTLMLLLKETSVIHLGCFLCALGVLVCWRRLVPASPLLPLAERRWSNRDLLWGVALSLLAVIFFFSGTFFNWHGVADFFAAYAKWFKTGTGDGGHVKEEYQIGFLNYFWLALMARYEWPSLLGLFYAVRLAWPVALPSALMMRYLAIYGVGALVAYSIVPYKTPWCIISILWPFSLLFGCAVQELWWKPFFRVIVTIIAVVALLGSLLITLRLNFRHFTDPKEPYVYVQTMPEISRVTEPVLAAANSDHRNFAMGGQIILDSYYPLPWIFGDFTQIGYYDKLPETLNGDFIVTLTSRQKQVENLLREPYLRCRFLLRDSMDECTVWFKESRFREWFANPSHGSAERVTPKS